MSERQTGWIRHRSIEGGWLVYCRLCGKDFKRSFVAANTDYADAYRESVAFGSLHEKSDPHRAALEAFHVVELPKIKDSEEDLLRAIFGEEPRTDMERRRDLVRRAAWKAQRTAASR